MRDPEKTIGNIVDKQTVSFLGSVDEEGFPNIKAMLQPRKREGIRTFYFTTNTSSRRVAQFRENDRSCIYFVTDPDYCVLKFTAFSGRYYSGFKSEDFSVE